MMKINEFIHSDNKTSLTNNEQVSSILETSYGREHVAPTVR